MTGGNGNDTFYADASDVDGSGNLLVSPGAGNDTVNARALTIAAVNWILPNGLEVANGTNQNDILNGTNVTNGITISGFGGADTITGGSGADFLYGGDGDDTIFGGSAVDRLFGETTMTSSMVVMTGSGLPDRKCWNRHRGTEWLPT